MNWWCKRRRLLNEANKEGKRQHKSCFLQIPKSAPQVRLFKQTNAPWGRSGTVPSTNSRVLWMQKSLRQHVRLRIAGPPKPLIKPTIEFTITDIPQPPAKAFKNQTKYIQSNDHKHQRQNTMKRHEALLNHSESLSNHYKPWNSTNHYQNTKQHYQSSSSSTTKQPSNSN